MFVYLALVNANAARMNQFPEAVSSITAKCLHTHTNICTHATEIVYQLVVIVLTENPSPGNIGRKSDLDLVTFYLNQVSTYTDIIKMETSFLCVSASSVFVCSGLCVTRPARPV